MTGIVKAQKGLPALPAEFLQRRRFAAGHVGFEAGEKDNTRQAIAESTGGQATIRNMIAG